MGLDVFISRSTDKAMLAASSLLVALMASGCGGNIKFEKTADELVAKMERDGAVVPIAAGIKPSRIDRSASLAGFAMAAAESSPSVASAKRLLMAAESRVVEAQREFYPQVALSSDATDTHQVIVESSNSSLEGDDTKYNTTNIALTASLRLVDLPMSASVVAARHEAEARAADYEASKQDILQSVLSSYTEAAEALERWTLAQAEVKYYIARSDFEQRQSEAGEMRASDLSVAAAELARARSDASIASADYRIRADRLCGLAFNTLCPYPAAVSNSASLPAPIQMTQEEIDEVAQSPEIRAMSARVNVALREVDRARMAMYPRLSLEISAAQRDRGGSLFDGSSLSRSEDVSVLFQWDLYTSGRLKSIRDAELNEALAAGHEYEVQLQTAVNDMRGAGSALRALWEHDRSLNRVVQLRRSAVGEIQQEISAGVATTLELAEARLDLVRVEVLRQRTRRNYLAATLARARATGKIDEELIAMIDKVLSDDRNSVRVYGPIAR